MPESALDSPRIRPKVALRSRVTNGRDLLPDIGHKTHAIVAQRRRPAGVSDRTRQPLDIPHKPRFTVL
jgi:hypothetical protein